MFRGHHRKVQILFGISDALLIGAAFELAYLTRQRLALEHQFFLAPAVVALLFGWSVVVWVGLGLWWELYSRVESAHPSVILRDVFRQCLVGAASVVLLQYLGRMDLSRSFVAFFAGYAWVLICLFRLNAKRTRRMLRGEFGSAHYVMVVGLGPAAVRLGHELEDSAHYGIQLLGFLADSELDPDLQQVELDTNYPVFTLSELPDLLRSHVIDEIIFAVDSSRLAQLEESFLLCDEEGVRTRVAVDFFPHVNSQVYLDRLGTSPLLTFSATPHDEIRLLVKRIIDVMLAGAALALLAPLMVLVIVLIRLTSPGPAIFRQVRCGLNGRKFVFYKFRSMCEDAHQMRESLRHLSQRELAM